MINRKILVAIIALSSVCYSAASQDIVYTDAAAFPVYGKVSDRTSARYERLPLSLLGVSRDPVWYLGKELGRIVHTFPLQLHVNICQMGIHFQQYDDAYDGHRYQRTGSVCP